MTWALPLAMTVLAAGCGGSSSSSPSATQAPSAVTVTATPTPSPAASGPSVQQLLVVAAEVYRADGTTCEDDTGGKTGTAVYAGCPFTSDLAQTLASAQQAQVGPGSGNVLCHCQAGPKDYAASNAQPSASGGTVTVLADYGGDNLTYILTVLQANGQLLVSDIHVQQMNCATPEPIQAPPC